MKSGAYTLHGVAAYKMNPGCIQIMSRSHSALLVYAGHFQRHSCTLRRQAFDSLRPAQDKHAAPTGRVAAASAGSRPGFAGSSTPCHDQHAVLQLDLPTLECIFPVKCHPEVKTVEEEGDEWAMSTLFGQPPLSPEGRLLYKSKRLAYFLCVYFPSTPSLRRLILITKLFKWFTCLDDILEHADDQVAVAELEGGLLHMLGNLQAKSNQDVTSYDCSKGWPARLLECFWRDIWVDMCRDASSRYTDRLAKLLCSGVLTITRDERSFRKLSSKSMQNIGSTEDFLDHRARTGFLPFIWLLLEYSLQVELDQALPESLELPHDSSIHAILAQHFKVERHDCNMQATLAMRQADPTATAAHNRANCILAELLQSASRHLMAGNDYISFRREFFQNDFHSLPGLFFKQRGGDVQQLRAALSTGERNSSFDILQQAVYEVYNIIKEQEGRVASVMEQIKGMHAAGDCSEDILRYAEEVCNGMAGVVHWSNLTTRYQGLDPTTQPLFLSDAQTFYTIRQSEQGTSYPQSYE